MTDTDQKTTDQESGSVSQSSLPNSGDGGTAKLPPNNISNETYPGSGVYTFEDDAPRSNPYQEIVGQQPRNEIMQAAKSPRFHDLNGDDGIAVIEQLLRHHFGNEVVDAAVHRVVKAKNDARRKSDTRAGS